MVAVNTCGSTTYRHQFTASRTTTTISFSSMLASGNSQAGFSNNFTSLFSSGDNDSLLTKLYEQMTGQSIGARFGVTGASDGVDLFFPMLSADQIDMSRMFNEYSKGDRALTDEDIAMLKSKYDIENLSSQDRYDLFCDLTDMGILTADEAMSAGRMVVVQKSTISFSYTAIYVNAPVKEGGTLFQQLMDMIGRETEDYNAIVDLTKRPDGARFKVVAAKLEASITHHQKVASVLEQLSKAEN